MNYMDPLHTKSDYIVETIGVLKPIKKQSDEIIEKRVISQISQLEQKEKNLYRKFNCETEEDFYNFIHNFFDLHKQDFDVISRFTATNLDGIINQLKSEVPQNALAKDTLATIVIEIDDKHNNIDLAKEFEAMGLIPISSGNKIKIVTSLNTPKLKQIVNKARGTHFQAEGKDKRRNEATTLLYSYLEQNVVNGIDIYLGDSTKEVDRVTFKTSFLQYNSAEITSMLETDVVKRYSSVREGEYLLEVLYNKIKNLVIEQMCAGGSALLKNSALQVWNQRIGEKGYDGMIDFFTGGRNWEKVLKGAFGEFQVALFFQYLSNSYPQFNLGERITKLIGSEVNAYKQYLHSDVKFLEMLGIQVKNFSSSKGRDFIGGTNNIVDRTISVALHPSEIARISTDEEVVGYITNSFFNRTFGIDMGGIEHSKEYIISFFENYASELLNLDMNIQNISIPDQVSFYMIGGRFVPGSAILKAAFITKDNKKRIEVYEPSISGTKGYTDEDFNLSDKGKHAPPARLVKWWHGTPFDIDSWTKTQVNNLNEWDKNISIKTRFTYTAFWENSMYTLFK